MNEQCFICSLSFNHEFNPAYVACQQQHIICRVCFYRSMQETQVATCPFCRESIVQSDITVFQPYLNCELYLEKQEIIYQSQTHLTKSQCMSAFFELLQFDYSAQTQDQIRSSAVELMKNDDYETASLILRKLIQINLSAVEKQSYIGLGMQKQEEGWYQSQNFEWYQKKFGERISLFDMLNICYLKYTCDFEDKRKWFLKMLDRNPQSYKIMFVLAIAFMNFNHYSAAQTILDKIISINQSFSKPYLAKAFIYDQLREDEIAVDYTKELQKRDPNNIHAMYIEAINSTCSNDQIRQKLQIILEIQPCFLKAKSAQGWFSDTNEQKIKIYEQCHQLNKDYIEIEKQLAKMANQQDENRFVMFMSLFKRKRSTTMQKAHCIHEVGRYFMHWSQFDIALELFKKQESLSAQPWNIE